MNAQPDRRNLRPLTASIVRSHLLKNAVDSTELSTLIEGVHAALERLGRPAPATEPLVPAVPVKKSVRPDHLVCLEDGLPLKTLKRHLAVHHGLTPAEYRAKWGLPADYPMTAAAYSEARSGLARAAGLGRKRTESAPTAADASVDAGQAPVTSEPPVASESEPVPKRRTLKLVLPKD